MQLSTGFYRRAANFKG